MDEPSRWLPRPVHRALTEPILLGGAPRSVAILNGTLAAALGLGLRLWLAGLAALGRRPSGVGVGRQARSALRRRRPPAPAHPRSSHALSHPMMNLAEYRRSATRLADFLPWAALVDAGVVLNKDGSFQRTARFRGPDLDSAVPPNWLPSPAGINNALRRLGSGWAIFVEAQRHSGRPLSHPGSPSGLGPGRRRAQGRIRGGGGPLEASHFLTFLDFHRRRTPHGPSAFSMRDASAGERRTPAQPCAASSIAPIGSWNSSKASCPRAGWLDDAETLTYLHLCIHPPPACPRARGADVSRHAPGR